jgi:hypothetical protein
MTMLSRDLQGMADQVRARGRTAVPIEGEELDTLVSALEDATRRARVLEATPVKALPSAEKAGGRRLVGHLTRLPIVGRVTGIAMMLGLLSATAAADEEYRVCLPIEVFATVLTTKDGEFPVARAITNTGDLVTVWARADGASWTMTVTAPSGVTCIAGMGQAYLPVLADDAGSDEGEP